MKIYQRVVQLIGLFLIVLIMSACEEKTVAMAEEEQSEIEISKEQFRNEAMAMVNVETQVFQETIKTTGVVELKPQSLASIYSSISGKVKSISVEMNSLVKKGANLVVIESGDFIQLQQEYLEAKAGLRSKTADYNRTKQLFEKNITSEKEFVKIESQYQVLKAKLQALSAKLEILQVDMEKLNHGDLSNYFVLRAPIAGYISDISVNLGRFVGVETPLMNIIDMKGAQLVFPIYTQFLDKVEQGQRVVFYASESSQKQETSIQSIGKSLMSNIQASECIASLEELDKGNLVPGMKVQVEVLAKERTALAIPNTALIKSDGKFYVLMKKEESDQKISFEKVRIEIGEQNSKFTELKSNLSGEVLSKGTYYLSSEE